MYMFDTLRVLAFTDDHDLEAIEVTARPSIADDGRQSSAFVPIKNFSEATTVDEVQEICDAMLGWQTIPFTEPAKWAYPPGFQKLSKRVPFKIATSASDLTPDWCTTMFRYQGILGMDETVTKLETHPIGAGEGEFSELAIVNITSVDSPRGAPKLPRR